MKNGIFLLEFMTFESLVEDDVHEFLFILTPLRIKGATGSPGRPIAIRQLLTGGAPELSSERTS